jgi:hypothetical protein
MMPTAREQKKEKPDKDRYTKAVNEFLADKREKPVL